MVTTSIVTGNDPTLRPKSLFLAFRFENFLDTISVVVVSRGGGVEAVALVSPSGRPRARRGTDEGPTGDGLGSDRYERKTRARRSTPAGQQSLAGGLLTHPPGHGPTPHI